MEYVLIVVIILLGVAIIAAYLIYNRMEMFRQRLRNAEIRSKQERQLLYEAKTDNFI